MSHLHAAGAVGSKATGTGYLEEALLQLMQRGERWLSHRASACGQHEVELLDHLEMCCVDGHVRG